MNQIIKSVTMTFPVPIPPINRVRTPPPGPLEAQTKQALLIVAIASTKGN